MRKSELAAMVGRLNQRVAILEEQLEAEQGARRHAVDRLEGTMRLYPDPKALFDRAVREVKTLHAMLLEHEDPVQLHDHRVTGRPRIVRMLDVYRGRTRQDEPIQEVRHYADAAVEYIIPGPGRVDEARR